MSADLRSVALERLLVNVKKSGRHKAVPFHPAFIRQKRRRPPLARLIFDGGGQGGAVRLRLYLYITLVASGAPYDLKQPPVPKAWAERLALPPATGARRVNDALAWLEENELIKLRSRPGGPDKITLLSARGDGTKYAPRTGPGYAGYYVSVPLGFWREGWLITLSPTAIALLFALIELQSGREGPQTVSPERKAEYHLSRDTWTRATRELKNHGILKVGRTAQDGNEFVYNRVRNTYWVNLERLNTPPAEQAETEDEPEDQEA